ncbi:hypothetical protein ACP70R_011865 [Stipagrostis hirtigluma subsp. patula]
MEPEAVASLREHGINIIPVGPVFSFLDTCGVDIVPVGPVFLWVMRKDNRSSEDDVMVVEWCDQMHVRARCKARAK